MGGYGSGRFKVLTDFQREVRKRKNDTAWRKKNPERARENMRAWRAKNHERSIALSRESKARKKLRMIEDAFERVMDKRDGFAPEVPEVRVSKKRNYKTEKFRAWNRAKSKSYYSRNKEKVKAIAKKCYYKNLDANRKRKNEYAKKYYHRKKLEKQ